ncbi:hypothetical protein [Saccharothrix sp.]|uniref:hypothetical protein n=1 Tax=Saccharothrix sp. TaxID=1873460 RepID=UPI0028124B81|nr:hypothetical protein [Saccharothrix sp.]
MTQGPEIDIASRSSGIWPAHQHPNGTRPECDVPQRQRPETGGPLLTPLPACPLAYAEIIHRRLGFAIHAWPVVRRPGTGPPSPSSSRRSLRRSAHRGVAGLEADAEQWIDAWNDHPKPFVWTKTADDIFDNLARYRHRINNSRPGNA